MGATIDFDDDKRLRHKYDEGMERGFEEGVQKGIEKGIQKGRESGRNEGEARILRIQLQKKFGPLSSIVEQQLQSANQEQLECWGERVLFVATIDEVLQEPSGLLEIVIEG